MEPATDGALAGRERGEGGGPQRKGAPRCRGEQAEQKPTWETNTRGENKKKNGKAFGVGGLKPGGSKKGETNKKKGGT